MKKNGLTDYQYSGKLFLKIHPLRSLLSCHSPPSPLSSTMLSFFQLLLIFILSLTLWLEIPPSDPSTSSLEKVGPPSTHHSHQARDTETQSRGTSSLVKADVDVDKRDSPRLPNVHLVKADVDVDKRDSPRLSLPLLLDSTLRPLLLVSS